MGQHTLTYDSSSLGLVSSNQQEHSFPLTDELLIWVRWIGEKEREAEREEGNQTGVPGLWEKYAFTVLIISTYRLYNNSGQNIQGTTVNNRP